MTQDARTPNAHTAHSLAGAYALDALSEIERRGFESHMDECETCSQEVRGLQETAARLAVAAAQPPPPGLRDRVLAEAAQVRQLPPRVGTFRVPRRWLPMLLTGAAAACLAVAVALGVGLLRTQDELDSTRAMNDVLTAPDARSVTQPVASGGHGTVVASRAQGRAVIMMSGLRPLPPSRVYELWFMKPGTARPAGLWSRDSTPLLLDLGDAASIGLTVEPAGGSKTPTTRPIFNVPLSG